MSVLILEGAEAKQSDVGTDTKPTAFHDEKPVGAPNELVTVSTLLVFESRII